MKPLIVIVAAACAGLGLGAAMGYIEVGSVADTDFGPNLGDASVPAAAKKYPSVQVDAPLHDFGAMQRGTTATHDFLFKNTGSAPLRLKVGSTSCKCTLGDVADRPLAPGETSEVRLEWIAKSAPGRFRQTANVETNDPRNPTVELVVEGLITETTGLMPSEFLLGQMSTEDSRSATVFLGTYDDRPLEATARMSDSTRRPELFDVSIEPIPVEDTPLERATSAAKITIKAGPGLPMGVVAEWVEVETNSKDPTGEGNRVLIPLLAQVEGDITLHGAGWSKALGVLNLGKIRSSQGKAAKLRVAFKGEHAASAELKLQSVDPEWLQVELEEPLRIREGVVHIPMTVRVPQGVPSVIRSGNGAEAGGQGDGDARIQFTTSHPTTPEVDVRVRFVVAE